MTSIAVHFSKDEITHFYLRIDGGLNVYDSAVVELVQKEASLMFHVPEVRTNENFYIFIFYFIGFDSSFTCFAFVKRR
jgi:hypothetical protein